MLFMLVLAGGGLAYVLRPDPPLEVETVGLELGVVREVVPSAASGEVVPARRVTVRAEMGGTVEEVLKRPGDRLLQGDLVVLFGSAELDARVAQARANVDAALVTVQIAKTRFDAVAKSHDRATKLAARGAISPVDLERSETERLAADQAVAQARAAEKQARAALDLARVAQERTKVTAPFPGVLQDVFAELGTQATPGAALFDLIDDASVRVRVPVDEADIGRIFMGQTVFLRTGANRDTELRGKVVQIPPAVGRSAAAPMVSPIQERERAFYIDVEPEDRARFFVGASVSAEFLVSERDQVLFVPTHLVVGTGMERSVFRVENGKAKKAVFKPGLTSWDRTEVVSGLSKGDQIVSSLNKRGLEDGVRVSTITKVDDATAAR
jgi:HlyD family secretion protein